MDIEEARRRLAANPPQGDPTAGARRPLVPAPEDFDGCSSSSCRPRNKPWQHTFAWGLCAHAPESARPEPRISLLGTYLDVDGEMSIGTTSFTLTEMAAKIEAALREVKITLGPNAVGILERGGTVTLSGGEYQAMALTVAAMLTEVDL